MSIKSTLADLSPENRSKIMQAFNELKACIIFLPDKTFLAVHTKPDVPYATIEQTAYWLLGRLQ